MRPLGSSPAPYLVPSAGSGVPLRAGAFVSLRVIGEAGGGLYRVLVGASPIGAAGGSELKASSSVPLLPGSLHRARVERAEAGDSRLVLRLLPGPEERQASLLASLGQGSDPASRLALAALLAEGLRPEAPSLARLRRLVQRAPAGREAEFAELAAGLEAKGLGAEAEAVEALAGLAEAGGGGGGEGGGSGGGSGQAGREQAGRGRASSGGGDEKPAGTEPEPAGMEPEPAGTELEPAELIPALAALLRSLLRRSAEPGAPSEALLGLYNHARSPSGASFLLPFRFALDLVEFAGSFRVHLPYMPGGQSRIEARFTVEKGPSSERWGFLLESLPGGRARLLLDAGRRLPEALVSELEADCAALGCSLGLGKGRSLSEGLGADSAAELDLHA